jgi:alkanesulfonate monooxygenase SsuD/methylene tetrahydromethanopterin reductase-like flavin-dependent oxidoreductase (luciferase family)
LKEGAGRGVRLNVQPVQRPHPPIWIAVQRREVLPYVARRGFSVALLPYATVENVSQLAASIHEFRGALPFGIRAQVSVAVHLYLGRDLEAARRALQRFLDSRMAVQADYFRGPLRVPPVRAQAQWLEDRLFALFGNRHEIESGIETFRSAGVDELLGIYDFGGLKIGSARATINRMSKLRESFDAALVPQVDSEPGPPKVVAQPAAVDSSGSYCRGAQRPILRSG